MVIITDGGSSGFIVTCGYMFILYQTEGTGIISKNESLGLIKMV